ncbi:MAG: GNAT family N-acetyltransferase [Nocardioides sp.]
MTKHAPRLTVRPERPEDADDVRALVRDAFGGEHVADLLEDLRTSPAWLDLAFVAEEDGALVAHVAFTRGWLDTPEGPVVEVLVLSPLSVRPDRQRAGVGQGLVTEALAALTGRAEPAVFLEGSPDYYPRFGFVPGATLGFGSPSVHIPEPAFQVLTLPSYREGLTGALVYPDAFWRHGAVGLRP